MLPGAPSSLDRGVRVRFLRRQRLEDDRAWCQGGDLQRDKYSEADRRRPDDLVRQRGGGAHELVRPVSNQLRQIHRPRVVPDATHVSPHRPRSLLACLLLSSGPRASGAFLLAGSRLWILTQKYGSQLGFASRTAQALLVSQGFSLGIQSENHGGRFALGWCQNIGGIRLHRFVWRGFK